MAESTERIDDVTTDADDAVEGAAPAARRGLPFIVVLAVAALVSAGLGGYLSYAYYADITSAVAGSADGDTNSVADTDEEEEDEEDDSLTSYGQFSEIEGVIINPASSGGQRFLMLNIGLEAETVETLDEVKAKDVVVRDTLLKILGSRSIEQLSDITQRNELKETLRTAVNGVLAEGEVKRLYFTRYVLQ